MALTLTFSCVNIGKYRQQQTFVPKLHAQCEDCKSDKTSPI